MLGFGAVLWICIIGCFVGVAFCGNNEFWEKDWYRDKEEA